MVTSSNMSLRSKGRRVYQNVCRTNCPFVTNDKKRKVVPIEIIMVNKYLSAYMRPLEYPSHRIHTNGAAMAKVNLVKKLRVKSMIEKGNFSRKNANKPANDKKRASVSTRQRTPQWKAGMETRKADENMKEILLFLVKCFRTKKRKMAERNNADKETILPAKSVRPNTNEASPQINGKTGGKVSC